MLINAIFVVSGWVSCDHCNVLTEAVRLYEVLESGASGRTVFLCARAIAH